MDAMAAELRERYTQKDDEELIELRARNDLTDTARQVLDREIARRGIANSIIADASAQQIVDKQRIDAQKERLASIGSRCIAYLIDLVGTFLLAFVIHTPFFRYTSSNFSQIAELIIIAAMCGYLLFKDGFGGQSVGKRILHIKVLTQTSDLPCSFPKSLARNIFGCLGFIDGLFALGEKRQRLGDLAAGTYVVRARVQ